MWPWRPGEFNWHTVSLGSEVTCIMFVSVWNECVCLCVHSNINLYSKPHLLVTWSNYCMTPIMFSRCHAQRASPPTSGGWKGMGGVTGHLFWLCVFTHIPWDVKQKWQTLKYILRLFSVEELTAYWMRVLSRSELIEKPLKPSLRPDILPGAPAERMESGPSGVTSDQP